MNQNPKSGTKYPRAGEIDLMKYADEDLNRTPTWDASMVADSQDVTGLLFISGVSKKLIIFLMVFTSFLSTACSKNTLYLTPEAVGYIYDSKTHKPLKNQTGDIGFSGLTKDEDAKIVLREDGSFSIPAVTKNYYFIRPKVGRQYASPPPEIYIYFKNYEPKIVDYSYAYVKQVPESKSGFSYFNRINLGIIYLDYEK